MTQPYNIVLIMADQLGAAFVGCYGSGVDSTPALDRLAAESMRFDRFYASSPVCAPNRATVLTGRSPEIHGMVSNHYALPADTPTFAHVLRDHGYRTAMVGKIHQTPMQWAPPTHVDFLGFESAIISEDPKWGPWIDWVAKVYPEHYATALAMTNGHAGVLGPGPLDLAQGATADQAHRKAAAYPDAMQARMQASPWERMYPSPLPPEVHDTAFITECGLNMIDQLSGDSGIPFLCHISYVDPHDPYDPPEPYASMFDPAAIPDPIPAEWPDEGPQLLDRVRDGYLGYRAICENPQAVKQLRALYHGSVRMLDDQVGRIVERLKASGLWETTVVVFTTDHGDMMGDHGLIAKGLPHYDTAIRCPLIVAGGPIQRGESDALHCSLDLFPTLCAWAGIPAADLPPVEGRSFAGACTDGVPDRGWAEVSVAIGNVDTIISDDGWRLTRYSGNDAGQLFDLGDDPHEQHNLYDDPDCVPKKVEMLERLAKARALPRLAVQYRTLPARDGQRWDTNSGRAYPLYALESNPWLNDHPKPEWHGTDPEE